MNRNNLIDFVRIVLAVLVIAIHTLNIHNNEIYIIDFSRIAVPCFFIISGYFIANKEKDKILKSIKNTMKIFIISNFIYFVWAIVVNYNGLRENFTLKMLDIKTWIKFFVFNDSVFRGHLWFISAILYCHIIYYIYINLKKKTNLYALKKITIVVAILISITIILSEIVPIVFGKNINKLIYRNFFFLGLPYYLIGIILKNTHIKKECFRYVISFLITLSIYLAEITIIKKMNNNIVYEHYISTFMLSINIIIFAISYQNILKDTNKISKLGRELSLDIYIIHVIVIDILKMSKLELTSVKLFILTIIISVSISWIIEKIKKGIKNENFINRWNRSFKFGHKRLSDK